MTFEEFREKQLREIARRWLSISEDLQALCERGTIKEEMTVKEVREVLSAGPKE